MGKRAQKSRGIQAPPAQSRAANAGQREAAARFPRLLLGIGAVLGTLLFAGLVAVILTATGAFATGGSGSLPAGTQTFAEPDHAHVEGPVSYDRVPPAGGRHNPTPLNCGVYSVPVPDENAVHSLEHGAVWITYRPTLPPDQIALLQQLATSSYVGTERYVVLSPYAGIPSPVVVSAWGAQLGVDQASDSRLADFIHHFAGGGQGGEKGGPCTGGVGSPVE